MPVEILRASSSLLAHVAEPAARSIVLGCCAAVALGALRVRNVAARMSVWRGVLAAALAMPLLGLLVVPVRVSVPTPLTKIAKYVPSSEPSRESSRKPSEKLDPKSSASVSVPADTNAPVSHVTIETRRPNPARIESPNPPNRSAEVTRTGLPSLAEPAPALTRLQISWALLLAALYVTITIVFFVRMWLGIRFSARLERSSARIEDEPALAITAAVSRASGLLATPRLAESEMLSVPVTLGVRNPAILFPVEWREWESGELEAVLAHEISHVARRDALVQRLALIHRAIFWFSPFAWWLEKHLVNLSEEASDEAALASGADRTRYAETLLGFFATLEGAPQRVWWQGVSMAKAGQAEKRVDRILSWRGAMSNHMSSKLTRSLMVALVAVAAPVVLLTASVHPTVSNFQEPIVDPEPQSAALTQTPARPQAAPAVVAPQPNPAVNVGPSPAEPNAPSAAPIAPMMSDTPVAAIASSAPMAPPEFQGQVPMPPPAMGANSDEVQQAYKAMLRAQESLVKANQKIAAARVQAEKSANDANLEAIKSAKAAYKAAMASYKANLKQYYTSVAEARQIAALAQSINGVTGGIYGGVSGGVHGDRQYRIVGNYSSDWGPRFVIVTKGSGDVTMSGTEEDAEHARSLRNKISGDFIWFERDEKSYIITDPDFISKAKALFAPQEELARKQDELGRQQDELGRQQDALGKQMDDIKVKIPDITPDLVRVRAELDQLRRQDGGSQRDLGRLQSELGRLQSEVGHYQSEAGRQQGEIGHQQGELGRKQGELGRQQGELGREQGELARKASRELRDMFSDAVDKGIAKPE